MKPKLKHTGPTLRCSELKLCLQKVAGSVEKRTGTIPILSNVLVNIRNQRLSVRGTDLEVTLQIDLLLSLETDDIEFTVSAKSLSDICSNAPEDSILLLSLTETSLKLTVGACHYTLQTLPVEDFPATENPSPDISLKLPQKTLKQLFQKTLFSASDDTSRYVLTGVLIEIDPKAIRAVTTDGHRLSFSEEKLEGISIKQKKQIILPKKGAHGLQRLLENTNEPIEISFSANDFNAKTSVFSFTSRLIDGAFPDYSRVIPKDNTLIAKVSRGLLKSAIDRANILVNDKTLGITLEFQENILNIFSKKDNTASESSEDQIQIIFKPEGNPLRIGLNIGYIKDVIAVLESDNIIIHLKNENSPLLIEEESDTTNTLYLIMPLRL